MDVFRPDAGCLVGAVGEAEAERREAAWRWEDHQELMLMLSMEGTKEHYHLDMADVFRGFIVLNKGVMCWPADPPISTRAAAAAGPASPK